LLSERRPGGSILKSGDNVSEVVTSEAGRDFCRPGTIFLAYTSDAVQAHDGRQESKNRDKFINYTVRVTSSILLSLD
jgi:hypothetical protein